MKAERGRVARSGILDDGVFFHTRQVNWKEKKRFIESRQPAEARKRNNTNMKLMLSSW